MKAYKEDRFLRGRQTAYLICEHFRVTGANDSVDLFTVALRNNNIQEFDTKWDEILLSMTQIPSHDILENLYKLRIRESEKLQTVLELYNMEMHQKKAEPDYHIFKTMVKRSIKLDLRNRNFGIRSGIYEGNAVVKNQRVKVSLEEQKDQKDDRFLRGRQIAYMSYDYFRITGAHDAVLDYADLFTITLRNDDVQEFDTRCDEILLSMTKIPPDDILESLYKLRIRKSDQLKTILELYDMELHQKISMPDHQKLKTMWRET